MELLKTILGLAAGIISLAAFIPYILSIIKGKTKPKRATWWIWTLNSLLLLTSYKAEGAEETVWLAVAYAIGCIVVALFTIKYGIGTWSKLDRFCLGGTLVAATLWIIIGPFATLVASLIIDLLGVMPTMYASFYHPEEEDKLSWFLWLAGGFLSLLIVEDLFVWYKWSPEMLTIASYPAQITITAGIIFWFLTRPRHSNSPTS